jgi:hypothetical protein
MVRDPRRLDQNPVVIDPANVDAVLDDRPTPVSNPSQPALDEIKNDNNPRSKKLGPKSANSPVKSSEPRRR